MTTRWMQLEDKKGRLTGLKRLSRCGASLQNGMLLRNKTPKRRVTAKLPDDSAEAVEPNDA